MLAVSFQIIANNVAGPNLDLLVDYGVLDLTDLGDINVIHNYRLADGRIAMNSEVVPNF